MYQRAFIEEQFTDLWEGMEVAERSDAGLMMSWTGTHPATGCLTTVKDWQSGAVALSQLPIPAWVIGAEWGAGETN